MPVMEIYQVVSELVIKARTEGLTRDDYLRAAAKLGKLLFDYLDDQMNPQPIGSNADDTLLLDALNDLHEEVEGTPVAAHGPLTTIQIIMMILELLAKRSQA